MIKYSFTKMNGAGNDFIMFNLDKVALPELTPQRIRNLCDRKFGIGADGIITIRQEKSNEFSMSYYNSDGSTGTLCGNGSRCAVRFAQITGKFAGNSVTFHSLGNTYHADITGTNEICFWLQAVKEYSLNFQIEIAGSLLSVHYADTGSPHVVVPVGMFQNNISNAVLGNDLKDLHVDYWGRLIRHAEVFPNGVNVNFIQVSDSLLSIRTFERGVEAETSACGTGSVAAAIVCGKLGLLGSPVTLQTKSGKILSVAFRESEEQFVDVSLTGPADVNFTGECEII